MEEKLVKDVVCPKCGKSFHLAFDSGYPQDQVVTLVIHPYISLAIEEVYILCPWCGYREEL